MIGRKIAIKAQYRNPILNGKYEIKLSDDETIEGWEFIILDKITNSERVRTDKHPNDSGDHEAEYGVGSQEYYLCEIINPEVIKGNWGKNTALISCNEDIYLMDKEL